MRRSAAAPDAFETANRLHSAAIHLLRRLRRRDSASGIGPAQLSALSVLLFANPLSLRDLAAAEQVRPPTMSRIVRGLERAGLAARAAHPRDRRAVRLRATARGRRLLQRARARRVAELAVRLRRLSARERRLLGDAATLIERLLDREPMRFEQSPPA